MSVSLYEEKKKGKKKRNIKWWTIQNIHNMSCYTFFLKRKEPEKKRRRLERLGGSGTSEKRIMWWGSP
jgi:hypothetical protein